MDWLRSALRIQGGRRLCGRVTASGSKNAALPIMAATILADGPITLSGVPDLSDVNTLALLLGHLGIEAKRGLDANWRLETVDPSPIVAPQDLVRRLRASFCVLGPLLARRGGAVVSLPGGCKIGNRPVDLHLAGLRALGADIRLARGYVIAEAKQLRGAQINLSGPQGPTVTGTANVMSAAVLAQGKTVITGAAREPEIIDLGQFLNAMGAKVAGLGTDTIEIVGVEQLHGTRWRIIPDRIEVGTLLIAGAITQGHVTVEGAVVDHLRAVIDLLLHAGCDVSTNDGTIVVAADSLPQAFDVTARPFPHIPTDLQAQFTALLALAAGTGEIRDGVFPRRFHHMAELNRMGAQIARQGPAAIVRGVRRLLGTTVTASDLRASAALLLAGLAAEGETVLLEAHHLDRGYERLDHKLAALGARITRDDGSNVKQERAAVAGAPIYSTN